MKAFFQKLKVIAYNRRILIDIAFAILVINMLLALFIIY